MTSSTSSMYTSGADATLSLSWHDSAWIPILNAGNVVDYFCQRSNPFYDRTCNNEVVRMQRLDPRHVTNMAGIEYVLIHAQEPVLYVIRKQHRHHVTGTRVGGHVTADGGSVAMVTTPLADYYIVAGVVYQSPDLSSVLNSRVFAALYGCQSAFATALSRARLNADAIGADDDDGTLGPRYSWRDDDDEEPPAAEDDVEAPEGSADLQPSPFLVDKIDAEASAAHLRRVDVIIDQLIRAYPVTGISIPGSVQTLLPETTEPVLVPAVTPMVNATPPSTSSAVASSITVGTKRHKLVSTEPVNVSVQSSAQGSKRTIGEENVTKSQYPSQIISQHTIRIKEEMNVANSGQISSRQQQPGASNTTIYKKNKHL